MRQCAENDIQLEEKEIEFMCAKVFYVFCHRDARSSLMLLLVYFFIIS